MKVIAVAAILALALAGCAGKSTTETLDKPPIAANKGAIAGVVFDDIYRPVPGGKVVLTPLGLTTTTNVNGEFLFVDLTPGTYRLLLEADGYEAAPADVDVEANRYVDAQVDARRLLSQGGRIDTIQYSVFLPCAVASPVILGTVNCLGDLTGDSYRSSAGNLKFTNDTTTLIFEVKASKPGNYVLAIRHDDGTPEGGEKYYDIIVSEGTYGKGIIKRNEAVDGFTVWKGDKPVEAAMFVGGQVQTNESGYGVGAEFGIEAQILISAFIGPPEVDLESYHLMSES